MLGWFDGELSGWFFALPAAEASFVASTRWLAGWLVGWLHHTTPTSPRGGVWRPGGLAALAFRRQHWQLSWKLQEAGWSPGGPNPRTRQNDSPGSSARAWQKVDFPRPCVTSSTPAFLI